MARATDRNRLAELLGTGQWLEAALCSGVQLGPPYRVSDGGGGFYTSQDPVAQYTGVIGADRLMAVSTTRGRKSARDKVGPSACTLTVKGGLDYEALNVVTHTWSTRQLEPGLGVRLQLTDAALTALGLTPGTAAAQAVKYRGCFQITDVGDFTVSGNRSSTLVIPLTLTSLMARWGNTTMTKQLAPTSDVDSLSSAMGLLSFDSGMSIFDWTGNIAAYSALIDARPPTTAAEGLIGFTPPVETSFQGIVDDWTAGTEAVMFETRDGRPDWVRPVVRRNAPAPVTLDPAVVRGPASFRQNVGDLVNHTAVTYGTASPQAEVEAADNPSQTLRGELADRRETFLASAATATDLARSIVVKYGTPRWVLPELAVDLTLLLEQGRTAEAVAILGLELTQLVELPSLPEASPVDPGLFWAEGMGDVISPGRWLVQLNLVDYAMLAPGLQWNDVPADVRWNDVPADLDWEHALVWHPDPYPVGAWKSAPSNLRWQDVPATVTWNTYT